MIAQILNYSTALDRILPTRKIEVALTSFAFTTCIHLTLGGLPLEYALTPAITMGAMAAAATLIESFIRPFFNAMFPNTPLNQRHVFPLLLARNLTHRTFRPLIFPGSISYSQLRTPNYIVLAAHLLMYLSERWLPAGSDRNTMSQPNVF